MKSTVGSKLRMSFFIVGSLVLNISFLNCSSGKGSGGGSSDEASIVEEQDAQVILQGKCLGLAAKPKITAVSVSQVSLNSGMGRQPFSGDTSAKFKVTFDKNTQNATSFKDLGCAHTTSVNVSRVESSSPITLTKAFEKDGTVPSFANKAEVVRRILRITRQEGDANPANTTSESEVTLAPERGATELRCVNASFTVAVEAQTSMYGETFVSDKSLVQVTVNDGCWTEKKLSADDPSLSRGSGLGTRVAVDGNWAAALAPKEPLGSILNAGSVRMFQKSGNQWSEFTKFSMGDVQADDNLSAVSLSGSTLALGSAYNNGEGAVYIYRWNGSAWTFSQKLTYPLSDSAPQFGLSLSLSGAILAVGAPSYSAGGDAAFDRSGAAFVFRDNGSTFSLDSTVTLGAGNTNKGFGSSVSVSGNFLAVGAPQAITKESLGAGTVYVYQLAAGSATLTKTLTAPNGATGERFGDSVSLLGSSLAVGAPLYQKDANVKAGAFFYWAN
ncbi:MAG: hypothetical protein AB7H97_07655 [Pseudobdellovibrionaceae bacterium]